MPEGPTLVILRGLTQYFAGERISKATGNAKIDKERLVGQRIVALRTWGKHFVIELDGFSVRIHFKLARSSFRLQRKIARASRKGMSCCSSSRMSPVC